ncbi:MAG: methylmalonyl Co-A mutase-associated GTPase MeaB [Synergistales bacterium]|nr:methylmalonyl Co-A mutase-associated GTPase MeaB [Synergistales bacterium]
MQELVRKALSGDTRSIARIITLVENESPYTEEIMKTLYPHSGKAHIVGITGSPGSGKSTLTDKLIHEFKEKGNKVGVIAIDPSSPFSGGAILADRIRMQKHAVDRNVYIRSMGSRGSLGGLSKSTYEAALILDACGKDIIFIETVGVGQSEVDIMKIADTVCLVLVPGMGDDIQIMKAGIMEIADIFIVNKADREGVERVVAEVKMALDLVQKRSWIPPVHSTIAEKGNGITELAASISNHHEFLSISTEGLEKRRNRLVTEVEEILQREIARFTEEKWNQKKTPELIDSLYSRNTDPYTVAGRILEEVLLEN